MRRRRLYPVLLRAGAVIPAVSVRLDSTVISESDDAESDKAYLRKVRAAGGIKKYERDHLNAIVASFAPKFSHLLPPELVRRLVEYAFHVGDY